MKKPKKEFKIAPPGHFIYDEWRKWEKAFNNFFSVNFILRIIPLVHVINKYYAPMTIMFDGFTYNVDPEDCCINAETLTGAVFKRDNVEVHNFTNSLNQGTKTWKWIEKSRGGRDAMKALREHYYVSSNGGFLLNITKAYLKELYFKFQDVLTFKKYVKRIKEAYNTLEKINQYKFEEQKLKALLDHIICPYYQVKSFIHTSRKDFKSDFPGSCTYLVIEIARIFPEKDSRSQHYRTSGKGTSNKYGINRRVDAAASGGHQRKKFRDDNVVDISNTSRYYSPDE